MRSALLIFVLAASAACSGRPNCSPETCGGCCTGIGTCEPGDSDTLCGTNANICATCAQGRTCRGGSCALAGSGGGGGAGGSGGQGGGPACSPQTCAGCCAAIGCQPGLSDTACGFGGNACGGCMPGETCVAGMCEAGGNGGGASGGPCGPKSCNGCCEGTVCVPVAAQTFMSCGAGGTFCFSCPPGGVCMNGQCLQTGNGGGSGGPAPDAGPPPTCTAMPGFDTGATFGTYLPQSVSGGPATEIAALQGQGAPMFDFLQISQSYPPALFPATPYTAQLQPGGFTTCRDCVIFGTGCSVDPMMQLQCMHFFVGQSGTLHVDQLTQDPDAGVYSGSIMNVQFVEYTLPGPTDPDQPVPGGQCVEIGFAPFLAHWP